MTLWKGVASRVRCMRTIRILQPYLDGNLGEMSARRVATHLENCRRCGLEASVYTEIKLALRGKDGPVDPEVLGRLRRFGEQLASSDESGRGDRGA